MKLKILLMLAAATAGLHGADAPVPYDIGEELATESFWKSDPVLFVKRHEAQGFNFTSGAREGADTRLDGAVTYKGIPVYETKVAFGELGMEALYRIRVERFPAIVAIANGKSLFSSEGE